MRVQVTGLGLWCPGYATVAAWHAREPDGATSPTAGWIDPRQRRRATPLTLMAAHALQHALAEAGREPADVAFMTTSVAGELVATFDNLDLGAADPPSSSPLRFGNSVHNAALGHLAISAGNRNFASAISAGRAGLVAAGLVEALGWVADGGVDAALVFGEEAWPGHDHPPLAVAVVLSADPPAGARARGSVGAPTRRPGTLPVRELPDPLARSPAAGALHLLDALLTGTPGRIALAAATPHAPAWSVDWSPA